MLYQKAISAIPTNLVTAAILIAVLWGEFDHHTLVAWGAANGILSAIRLGLVIVYRRKPRPPEDARQWTNAFVAGTVLSGGLVGALGAPLFRSRLLAYRVFVIFILGGLCAGSDRQRVELLARVLHVQPAGSLAGNGRHVGQSRQDRRGDGRYARSVRHCHGVARSPGAASFEESVRLRFEANALLKEKEILLKEVHHRVKNNLQMISSLFNLQAEFISDPGVLEIFRESQARVRAIAMVHQRLYQSSDLSMVDVAGYLRALVVDFVEPSGHDLALDVSIDVEPVGIGIDLAIPCGLAVNELVTNCIKHAFPGRRRGVIRIAGKKITR